MSIGKEFAILFGVLFLPGLIAQFGTAPANQFDSLLYNVQILAISVPQVLLVAWLPELNTPGMRARMGIRRPEIRDAVPSLLTATALLALSTAASWLLTLLPASGEGAEQVWQFSRPELLPLMVSATIAIGYREEIFYRAYLYARARELQVPPAATVLASSLLFGVGHLYQGYQGLVVTTALGATLGVIYLRTGNLHAVSFGHGLYNASVLVLSGTSVAP